MNPFENSLWTGILRYHRHECACTRAAKNIHAMSMGVRSVIHHLVPGMGTFVHKVSQNVYSRTVFSDEDERVNARVVIDLVQNVW